MRRHLNVVDVLAHAQDAGTTVSRVDLPPWARAAIRRQLPDDTPVESVGGLHGVAEFHLSNGTVATIRPRNEPEPPVVRRYLPLLVLALCACVPFPCDEPAWDTSAPDTGDPIGEDDACWDSEEDSGSDSSDSGEECEPVGLCEIIGVTCACDGIPSAPQCCE